MELRRTIKPWLGVSLWMGVIFVMSTDLGSSAHTSRIIRPFLQWLNPNISLQTVFLVQAAVRKGCHMLEYSVLALLALRAARSAMGVPTGAWSGRAAGLALLISAGFAATDEFHQMFVASRGASVRDVLIDLGGALLGLAAAFFLTKGPSGDPDAIGSESELARRPR